MIVIISTAYNIYQENENDKNQSRDFWVCHWKKTDSEEIESHALIIHSKAPKGQKRK